MRRRRRSGPSTPASTPACPTSSARSWAPPRCWCSGRSRRAGARWPPRSPGTARRAPTSRRRCCVSCSPRSWTCGRWPSAASGATRRRRNAGAGPIAVLDARIGGWVLLQPRLYVEIVDGDGHAVPPGTRGEVCVAGGFNLCLPLGRYRTGDFAELAMAEGEPVLLDFAGRSPVRFRAAYGRWHNNIDVSHALRHLPVAQFGLHQAGPARSASGWHRTRCGSRTRPERRCKSCWAISTSRSTRSRKTTRYASTARSLMGGARSRASRDAMAGRKGGMRLIACGRKVRHRRGGTCRQPGGAAAPVRSGAGGAAHVGGADRAAGADPQRRRVPLPGAGPAATARWTAWSRTADLRPPARLQCVREACGSPAVRGVSSAMAA